jgi:hypothetical protein
MGVQARYDPKEDRMLLSLEYGDGTARTFWLTRRQWIGMMHEMAALKLVPADEAPAEPPPKKNAPRPLAPQPEATMVQSVKVRKQEEGARLVFAVGEDQGVGMTLPAERLASFHRLLEQQAERAGWDPRAGVERLSAAVVARNVMRRWKGE